MLSALNRRQFLESSAACAAMALTARNVLGQRPESSGGLALNDDGHVFLYFTDDLHKDDLTRYLHSYCRPGVDTVAFCVGDMSWPTFYPTKVGVHYRDVPAGADFKRARSYKNLDNFAGEPGGFIGTTFTLLQALGKRALASFRMNDAHFTSADNPHASAFWKQHAKLSLAPDYGYYAGCLNYAHEAVRDHFYERVIEFAELYPQIDGIELDAMRSPYFFPPDKGPTSAPLFTDLVRRIKSALAAQAKKLKRPDYMLTVNVSDTPELALTSGLDVAAWDAEKLFDYVSAGTYQAYMDTPIDRWKKALSHGTPVFAYINCSAQSGQYFDLLEYRAAAANAYGKGADGIYLFNYPCLFELAYQVPSVAGDPPMTLPDMRELGSPDFSRVAEALDEMGSAARLAGKDKRYVFNYSNETGYRHFAPVLPGLARDAKNGSLKMPFHCYEDYPRARSLTLVFKIENVARTERFELALNGRALNPSAKEVLYAGNGRDTRIHTVALGPYLQYEIRLRPEQLVKGENLLEVTPRKLDPDLAGTLKLVEIELRVSYAAA